MKYLLIISIVAMLLLVPVFAHEEISAPEDIIKGIVARQGAANISQLDCTKITADEFESLGDSVMERMAGSHEPHEQMDNMMGGEGSTSLKQMHIAMGSNWLGCHEGMDMSSMMGGTVSMMPMMMRMMGAYYPAYYTGFDVVLILAIVGWILFIATLIYLLIRKK